MTQGLLIAPGSLHFTVDAPASKKNSGSILQLPIKGASRCPTCGHRASRPIFRPNEDALAAERALRDHLFLNVRGAHPRFANEDVRVRVVYHARREVCEVTVECAGARPNGFTGRRRDLSGVWDVIADAMQGPVIQNDNQVAGIELRRVL